MPAAIPLVIMAAGAVAKHVAAKKQAKNAAKAESANMAARWGPQADAAAARNSLIKGIMGGYGITSAVDPALMSRLTAPAAAPTSQIQGPSTLGMIGGGMQDFAKMYAAGQGGQSGQTPQIGAGLGKGITPDMVPGE